MASNLNVDQIQNAAGNGPVSFPFGASGYAPTSEIIVNSQVGYGASGTKVIYYSTVEKNVGSDVTYTASSTNGDSMTINTSGIYSIRVNIQLGASSGSYIGASRNASSTTNFSGLASPQIILFEFVSDESPHEMSVTMHLTAGDVIRAQTDAADIVNAGNYWNRFAICRVA